ncbi:hypothetical protein ACFVZH_07230 [Streptomyces sp. NPDC059534]|uniref:beta family protein n=1 Tax=Streptomyces sp. NPDC059534 TaxID=3346859 RepID=UPI0036864D72
MTEPGTEPIYVPVLPARRSALAAYGGLAPDVRAAVAPLWTVPPRVGPERTPGRLPLHPPDPDALALGVHVHRALAGIARVQRGRPAWVDTCHVESGPRAFVTGPPPLRPVTGTERAAWQQVACAEAAAAGGGGLGIRVRPAGVLDDRWAEGVGRLLRRIAFARCPLDLLLDLGPVDDADHGAHLGALHALDLLGALHPWRSVVLLAGSYPRTHPEGYGAALAETGRADRDLRDLLRHTTGGAGPRPVYGDYGAHDPASADRVSDTGADPFRGALRYTTTRTFLVGEVRADGPDVHRTVRSHAREIVDTPDFRGAAYSAGDRWLQACADGGGPPGTGHPDAWICAGHLQHLTHVARDLRRCP